MTDHLITIDEATMERLFAAIDHERSEPEGLFESTRINLKKIHMSMEYMTAGDTLTIQLV